MNRFRSGALLALGLPAWALAATTYNVGGAQVSPVAPKVVPPATSIAATFVSPAVAPATPLQGHGVNLIELADVQYLNGAPGSATLPTRFVRGSINLPFVSQQLYTVDPTNASACNRFTLDSVLDTPADTLAFLFGKTGTAYTDTTTYYTDVKCKVPAKTPTLRSAMLDPLVYTANTASTPPGSPPKALEGSAPTDGFDFGVQTRTKNIQFVSWLVQAPHEYAAMCTPAKCRASYPDTTGTAYAQCVNPTGSNGKAAGAGVVPATSLGACEVLIPDGYDRNANAYVSTPIDNSGLRRSLARYKAAQLLYQASYGIVPAYVDLFNEPEGTWNLQVDPIAYTQFVLDFRAALQGLVTACRADTATGCKSIVTAPTLTALQNVKILGPGLGSAVEFERSDQLVVPQTTKNAYFAPQSYSSETPAAEMAGLFAALPDALNPMSLSSHMYDEKPWASIPTTLWAADDLRSLIATRNANSTTRTPPSVVLTEVAASVERTNATDANNLPEPYMAYINGCVQKTGGPVTAPVSWSQNLNFCQVATGDDASYGAYAYPNCVDSAAQGLAAIPAFVQNFCDFQAAVLSRNLIAYQSIGASAELVWSIVHSDQSARHGLFSPDAEASGGLDQPSLMYYSTLPIFDAVDNKAKTTAYAEPTYLPTGNEMQAAGLIANSSNQWSLLFANASAAPLVYKVDLTQTPFASSTIVDATLAGGTWANVNGKPSVKPATGGSGGTLTLGSSFYVTVPALSTFVVDLAPAQTPAATQVARTERPAGRP